MISRRALLAGAVSLGVSARALAEDAPLDLQSGKRVKPPKDRPTDAPKLSDAEIIAKANDFLNTTRFMSADFVQIGPDGQRSEGLLVLLRPGRMLFRYKPPQKMEIVADGRSLEVRDQKLATQDLYLIGQTPLKFLLAMLGMAAGFLVMAAAARLVAAGHQVGMGWLAATYLLHTWAELALSPVGMSATTRLVPPRFIGQSLGLWFVSLSLGNLLASRIAGNFDPAHPEALPGEFMHIVGFGTLCAAGLAISLPFMRRWMREAP